MTRFLLRLAACVLLTLLALPSVVAAQGRGGGSRRGGGEGGGGMQRGGGNYGGGMSHSPSFSQPPSQSSHSNAGAAAAGAGAANRNQSSNHSNAGAAAAGAGAENRNQSPNHSNAGAAAAGAGYENRNQSGNHPNAAPAAAGAGYANRNQAQYPNAGAAAAGAGYANRNQTQYPNAGAAAAGAAYANNGYNNYGTGGGYWNGNYGNGSLGSYGGMGMASPSYGYGSTPYMNPYAGSGVGGVGTGQPQPGNVAAGNPSNYDYSQPVNTSAAPTDVPTTADPTTSPAAQAHQAFQTGDYPNAVLLAQQALGQSPNDVNLHQFLALGLFAQGNYEQAAAPLYAVLAVGPGWDWTTLIGNYTDAGAYTQQLRGLEAYVRGNPGSAQAQFVQAYHYICQGHGEAAIKPLKNVIALQPGDRVSAQILSTIEPTSAAATVAAMPVDPSNLPGVWVAQAPPNATITLTIPDGTNFTWAFVAPGRPPATIRGTFALADGVLTLSGKDTPGGPLVGQVTTPDATHMTFKAVGGPSSDPGLQFAR